VSIQKAYSFRHIKESEDFNPPPNFGGLATGIHLNIFRNELSLQQAAGYHVGS
jgi:hypothetical protein